MNEINFKSEDHSLFVDTLKQILSILYPNLTPNSLKKLDQLVEKASQDFPQNNELWEDVLNYFKLSGNEIESLLGKKLEYMSVDDLESRFLSSKSQKQIKKYAINYTELRILDFFKSFQTTLTPKNIIDPFGGTGRLLQSVVERLEEAPESVVLFEYFFIASLIGYLRLLRLYNSKGFSIESITIKHGDTFSNFKQNISWMVNKFDLIVMNPPFTRTHYFDKEIKSSIDDIFGEEMSLLSGQPGMHIHAILLSHKLLKQGGQILAVLPLSTFQSNYSMSLQKLLLENFQLDRFVIAEDTISFSVQSEFREVLIDFTKNIRVYGDSKFFTQSSKQNRIDYILQNSVNQVKLKKEWNWSIYFRPSRLLAFKELLSSYKLLTGNESNIHIKRGVEMYGPDFFCIPNSTWNVKEIKNNNDIISTGKQDLILEKTILTKALRKPGLYKKKIRPDVDHFVLNLPKSVPNEIIQSYCKGFKLSELPNSAMRKYGEDWVHHINHQLKTKDPYGNLFFTDKLAITMTGIIVHYTDDLITCTKNFYVIQIDKNKSVVKTKLLAAWFNSTIFLGLYLLYRREIGNSYGRMQIIDILNSPLFMDFFDINEEFEKKIVQEFDVILEQDLPVFEAQIDTEMKRKLDTMFLLIVGITKDRIESILDELYHAISSYLRKMI